MTNKEQWVNNLKGKYKVEVVKLINDRNLNERQGEAVWKLWREVNKSVREQALDPAWWTVGPSSETESVPTQSQLIVPSTSRRG
jgi:hypothetical protein